jgi:NAD(P)-dependent dehydrogenase (short-subunit alcohol dehydrogenase family)
MTASTALVTGGSRGIGAAISQRLAADGYAVAVNYVGNQQAADDVVKTITDAGGTAKAIQADVADPAQAASLIAQAGELGPLAVLVNNGGVSGPVGRHDEKDDDDLRRLVEINVLGVLFTCREAVRVMSTEHGGAGGAVVNIASLAAHTGGLPGLAAYAATKAAVVTFSRGLSTEVAGEGVRVNSVSPGTIETDMTTDAIRQAGKQAPVGRLGRPDEIANAVSWLVSDEAAFVTGTDITVSGGR